MAESTSSSSSNIGGIGKIVRSTIIVMIGYGLATVVGIIGNRIISGAFGTNPAYDTFLTANVIPELLVNMLAGGALAFAFVPIYTDILRRQDAEYANRIFSSVFNALLILACAAAVIAAVFAPALAPRIAPGFDEEQRQLLVQLMRLLLITAVIFSISSMITGLLQAHHHFLLPALSPSFYMGGLIVGAWLLAPRLGIFGLAWGAVLGASLHFLIQLPALVKYRIQWKPVLALRSQELRRIGFLMLPRLLDLLLAQFTLQWLNISIASTLGDGRIAALDYGRALMNMPWNLIGVTIGTVVFPTMSLLASDQNVAAQRRALSGSLRAVLALAIPAAAGLILLGRPLIQLLYEGGEFTANDTELVYYALQFWALMLISQSMLNVVVPAFAAQKDTWTPLYVSIFTTALNIGLAFLLSRPIGEGGFSHGGLPLARAIAVGLEVTIDVLILRWRWRGVGARRILLDAGKALIAAFAMGGAILGVQALLQPPPIIMLVIGGSVGALVYFGIALLLGIQEVRTIPLTLIQSLLRRQPEAAASS